MATAGLDSLMKIWDLRMFKCLHSYKTDHPAMSLDISDKNLLAMAVGRSVHVLKDAFTKPNDLTYLKHTIRCPSSSLSSGGGITAQTRFLASSIATGSVRFRPFEDILAVGHTHGLSTIIVPGTFIVYLSVYLSICLSFSLSVSLSVCLSACMSVCVSVCPSAYLSVFLSVCLSVCISVCLCVCLAVCLSVCLAVCLSVCFSVCLVGCLAVCLFVCFSVCLCVWLAVCLSVCFSVCLSICLFLCLSGCLSIYLSVSLCVCLSVCLSVICLYIYLSTYQYLTLFFLFYLSFQMLYFFH